MSIENRRQRDLAWCLQSQPLIVDDADTIRWPDPAWFEALDAELDPACLPVPPHPHHFRLGQHFEAMLDAWLTRQPGIDVVDKNLQVRAGKRTIGEFDFLVTCGGRLEHWEAAVKFYLGTGDGRTLAAWYGPNTSDRFDIKLRRLVEHQLVLGEDPHARTLLADRGLNLNASRCFMKGRLFHPWERFHSNEWLVPDVVNPAHERGWWLPQADFLPVFTGLACRFVYLPKSLWLAPLTPADYDDSLSCWELTQLLDSPATEQATHVAMVAEEGEISRGFIITNQWLNRIT